jgi:hypothetical protein
MSTTCTHSQGIIRIEPVLVKDYIDLTADPALIDLGKLKEVLLLPERYIVEQVRRYMPYNLDKPIIEIIVSSPDIPEVAEGESLPIVLPWYTYETSEDRKTKDVSLADIMINGVSTIKEGDKQRKVIVEIKEVIDNSGATI